MKISMTVMIVFTTILCVLPFLWFMLIGKNSTKNKEKQFKDIIKGQNLSLNIKEQWNDNFIGLDESQNILLYIKLINQEPTFLKIDLNQLKSSQINRKTREFKREKKMETELRSLELDLALVSKSEPICLNFYDIIEGFSEYFEMQRAEKWQALILQCKTNAVARNKAA